jgi:hypothetical protein
LGSQLTPLRVEQDRCDFGNQKQPERFADLSVRRS